MTAKSADTKGFLIDGFPANLAQAELFEKKIGSPTKIIVLNVNDVILKERLMSRSNFDDQPDAIQKRIETYNNQTKQVIKTYSKSVVNVRLAQIGQLFSNLNILFRSMEKEIIEIYLKIFVKTCKSVHSLCVKHQIF